MAVDNARDILKFPEYLILQTRWRPPAVYQAYLPSFNLHHPFLRKNRPDGIGVHVPADGVYLFPLENIKDGKIDDIPGVENNVGGIEMIRHDLFQPVVVKIQMSIRNNAYLHSPQFRNFYYIHGEKTSVIL